jgi:hypothetical protein
MGLQQQQDETRSKLPRNVLAEIMRQRAASTYTDGRALPAEFEYRPSWAIRLDTGSATSL